MRSVGWLLAAALALQVGAVAADGLEISDEDASAYAAAPHFKALAVSGSAADGAPLVRFSFNYDTPGDALQAALAYCEEARLQAPAPDRWAKCRPAWIGTYAVGGIVGDRLNQVLDRYLDDAVAALKQRLDQTNDRATRTSLETVLHKSGRYAQSEALLAGLAAAGEDLARNALAYHWAERNINLERALAYADSAVASRPDSASFHDTRALVLYRLGRLDAALAESERAVALNPHPIILDHRGDLLWAAWRCSDARDAWRRAAAESQDILFRRRVEPKIENGPDGPPVFD